MRFYEFKNAQNLLKAERKKQKQQKIQQQLQKLSANNF